MYFHSFTLMTLTVRLLLLFYETAVFQGYSPKPQHPMYRTEASNYGSKKPSVHTVPLCFHAKSQKFSEVSESHTTGFMNKILLNFWTAFRWMEGFLFS